MDVAKAFTFITEDERWLNKLGMAALVMLAATFLLLIPLPLLVGYQLGITRNVMSGAERPLPEWDNLGQLFMDGLNILVARLVYTLPFLLLICVGVAVSVLPALGGSDEMTTALAGVTTVTWLLISCLGLLLMLALFFISPAITIQYARTNTLSDCLRIGNVLALVREHIGDIVIVMLALFFANLVLQAIVGVLGATLCGLVLGLPLAWIGAAWLSATSGHLYGQIAAKGKKASGFVG